MHRRMILMDSEPQTPNPSTPGPPTPGPSTPGPHQSGQNSGQNIGAKGGLSTTVNKPMNNGKPGMNNTPFSPQPNMQQQNPQQQQQSMQQQQQQQHSYQQQPQHPNSNSNSAPIGAVIAAQEVVNIAMQERDKPNPNMAMRQVTISPWGANFMIYIRYEQGPKVRI